MPGDVIPQWEPSARDLEIYAEVVKGNRTPAAIGADHGIPRQRVNQIADKIESWLAPQYMERIREIKAGHTGRLMHMYHQAMEAWDASKGKVIIRTVKSGGKYGVEKSRRSEHRNGNPTYLAEARACLAEIRKIWGADAPLKVEHSGEIRVAGDVEGARQRMRDELAKRLSKLEPSSN